MPGANSWKIAAFDERHFTARPSLHLPRSVIWDTGVDWKALADAVARRVAEFRASPLDRDDAFYKAQLATLVCETNRLEGTACIDGSSMATIATFVAGGGSTGNETWPEEGGGGPQSPTTCRQWFQFCTASSVLLEALHEPLSADLLLRIHGIMMEGSTLGQDAGALRTESVCAGGRGASTHVFPNAEEIPGLLQRICDSFNLEERHPVQRASYLLYEVLSIHPFRNGNGRIARLFLSWSLMRDGFPFAVPVSSGHKQSQSHYLHAVDRARGQVYGATPTLAEINAIVLVSLVRVMDNFDQQVAEKYLEFTCDSHLGN